MIKVKTNGSTRRDYGRRLLPHVIDELAHEDPGREAFSAPRSANPKDGWKTFTFKELANAVNHIAQWIVDTCGPPSAGTFPTLAYLGPNDARYIVLLVAAMKAGYKALFISPRNSQEAQISLFESTECRLLAFPEPMRVVVQPWLRERHMKAIEVSPIESWFPEHEVKHFPYNKTFEQAEWEPAFVLHTSGSSGIPKAIVNTHGLAALTDGFHDIPERDGLKTWVRGFTEVARKLLVPMPLFHAAGLYLFIVCALYWETPIALGLADRPLTTDLVVECLDNLPDVEGIVLPPVIMEDMSQNDDHIRALARLNLVAFGGGNLNKDAGDRLVRHGIRIGNLIGATELGLFPMRFLSDLDLWQWFAFDSKLGGLDWRKVEGSDDAYQLFIVRKDKHPGIQGIFYTFPDLDEYDTKDMYKPHRSKPDHWIYYGRADNIIVFSNGEKLNPVTIEETVVDHPEVKGALVVGSNRFQAGLLVEPVTNPQSDEEAERFLDSVWPYVVKVNKETVAHGQIGRQMMALSNPTKPFLRAGKGTVQRALTIKLYGDEIDKLYEKVNDQFDAAPPVINVSSEERLIDSINELFQTRLGSKGELGPDTDFFSIGIDSLQVMNASRLLRAGLEASGAEIDPAILAPRVIYGNPTPRRLAHHIYSVVQGGGTLELNRDDGHEVKDMRSLWDKYTANLPAKTARRPDAADEGQTVLITGSTGMLGSYMLDIMARDPTVKKVICLNRTGDGGAERQAQLVKDRGLSADYTSKTEFLHVDMSRRDFGLPHEVYGRLLAEADRFIHNAWPVNFNIPVESFDPHLRGVRNVADFASSSSKRMAVTFISSIGTVDRWDMNDGLIPEERLEDLSLPSLGYGRSKLIGSLILEDVAKAGDFPAAVIRVGQIAGPQSEEGVWNAHEWLPSIIASSLHLGALPSHLGIMNRVDWTPVESIASLVLEVGGVSQKVAAQDISGYFHGVNPSTTTWDKLAPSVQAFYGSDRISELISFGDWVQRLEQSQSDATQALDKNPGVKLLDTYRDMSGAYEAGQQPIVFEMKRTMERSPTMRSAGVITPELMTLWCKQWNF
ncbi:acetyl-CoA synthetase-like protein [Hypoxylon sp. NC1633]|nr:acetyl-CoA synthetase-like protein [Hypoxylon sp. NC1633]